MPDNETKPRPRTIAPFRPPTPAEVEAYFKLRDWERARKVAEVKTQIEANTYDPDGRKLDTAVNRLIDTIVDRPDFTSSVATGMAEAEVSDAMLPGLSLPAAGTGCVDEEAKGDRMSGDRWE